MPVLLSLLPLFSFQHPPHVTIQQPNSSPDIYQVWARLPDYVYNSQVLDPVTPVRTDKFAGVSAFPCPPFARNSSTDRRERYAPFSNSPSVLMVNYPLATSFSLLPGHAHNAGPLPRIRRLSIRKVSKAAWPSLLRQANRSNRPIRLPSPSLLQSVVQAPGLRLQMLIAFQMPSR